MAQLICKTYLWQRSGKTSTICQISLNSGATNGDCNGEMASVRDNRATNNNNITTLKSKFYCIHIILYI